MSQFLLPLPLPFPSPALSDEFRQRLELGGCSEDELLEEAFAVVREASKRVLGMRHFDSQMVRNTRGQ